MGELDREVTDATGPAGYEQRLPSAQPEPLSDWCAVSEASGSAAASSKERPSGTCARKPSGTVVNSA